MSNCKKIYLAGPLFSTADLTQRKLEGKMLRDKFNDRIDLYNPIDQPMNDKAKNDPTPNEIFINDYNKVIDADIFICDITTEDPGTFVELGIAIQSNKTIIAVNSDIRLKTANRYDIPTYGMNHFVLGGILEKGSIVYSFEEAIELLDSILSK